MSKRFEHIHLLQPQRKKTTKKDLLYYHYVFVLFFRVFTSFFLKNLLENPNIYYYVPPKMMMCIYFFFGEGEEDLHATPGAVFFGWRSERSSVQTNSLSLKKGERREKQSGTFLLREFAQF